MWFIEEFYISLIFYKGDYCTMSAKIIIKQRNNRAKISSNSQDSTYLLIDKPYYVDGMRYKVDI